LGSSPAPATKVFYSSFGGGRKLATGESWTGIEALDPKLIDKLGGLPEALPWLKEKIGAKPEICW